VGSGQGDRISGVLDQHPDLAVGGGGRRGGWTTLGRAQTVRIDREQFSPEVQSVLHGDGPSTEVLYRLGVGRTYMKGMGLITNSQRGVWTVTEAGQSCTEDQFSSLHAAFVASRNK